MKVRQMTSDYDLVANSEEIQHVLESIGKKSLIGQYGSLFLKIHENEYEEIWGCTSSIPYVHMEIDPLYINIPVRTARQANIINRTRAIGLYIDLWSPGDGCTRYRFFEEESDYFGPKQAIYTALGAKEAENFLTIYRIGFRHGRHAECNKL